MARGSLPRDPRTLAGWALGSALLLVLTWPLRIVAPAAGLDSSWGAGLQLAWRDGLQFGRDVIFTYGPWGFTEGPVLYDPGAYRLAIAYTLLIRGAEVILVWVLVSRTWGRPLGWLVAALVLCATSSAETRTIVALAAAILILSDVSRRVPWWAAAGLGAWAGFEMLGKVSTGLYIVVVLGIALACGPRPRRAGLAAFAGGVLGGLAVAWLAAGQDVSAVADFARANWQIISGYAAAMGVDDPALRWAYWAALAIAVAAALGLRVSAQSPRVAVAGLVLVGAWTTFIAFKQAFVRLDPAHVALYFATMLALVAMLPWGRRHRGQALLALLLGLAFMFGTGAIQPHSLFRPGGSPSDLAHAVRLTYDAGERNALTERGRADMLRAYAFTPQTVAALQGHSVHVVPTQIGAAWALRLNWRPLPVFQDYSAYTSYLDARNVDRLQSDAGPDRVLQQRGGVIDARHPAWDPPRQAVTLLCRYRPVTAQATWRVLGRSADRCGPARRVMRTSARWGQSVPVPRVAPDELLTVRVSGLEPHGLEVLRSLVWRPALRYAKLDGNVVRVIPATAADGLLLQAPDAIDPPGPWRQSQNPSTITFLRGAPDARQPRGELQLTFEARPTL